MNGMTGTPQPNDRPARGRYDRAIFGDSSRSQGRRGAAGKTEGAGEDRAERRERNERRARRVEGKRGERGAQPERIGAGSVPTTEGSPGSTPNRDRTVSAPGRRRLSLQGQFMLFSLLALIVIGGGAWLFLRPAETAFVLDTFEYATVTERDFRDLIISTGTVEPESVTIFAAPIAGRVDAIYVAVGEDVAVREPLLRLVSDQLTEDLDEARNARDEAVFGVEQERLKTTGELMAKERDVTDTKRALAAAEEQLPLTEALFELGGVSAADMQAALNEVEQLRLNVESAERALALAERQTELAVRQAEQKARTAERSVAALEEQVEQMTVRAPSSGRVLALSVREGEHVSAGTELLHHADIARQEVKTSVSPEQAARLERGNSALFRVGGRSLPAVVTAIAPQALSGGERAAVPVTLSLEREAAAELRPFTEGSVELELGVRLGRPALSRGPFFASGDARFVYVVSEDGATAERREVRYGAIDGNYVEVVAGLEPGDRIVYSSYTAFRIYPTVELISGGGRLVEQ